MAQINPKITIRSVYFGMLLLSAAVMILAVRLTVASELDSLKAAAEQGLPRRSSIWVSCMTLVEGVPQNYTEAARWYRMAAEQGMPGRRPMLGYMYDTGRGVPQGREAARWYRMAAEQGDANGAVHLGVMYYTGRGVPQNDTEAVRWYRMAAEQGLFDASCRMLGSCITIWVFPKTIA